MKKILITGGCGFIGSHLSEFLIKKNYKVVVFDKYNRDNNYGWLENSKFRNDIQIILGDIRDYDSVEKSLKGCDTVFHLAALGGIPYSYISPLAYLQTNVIGTYNVLESSKKNNCENIIITSTSEVYGSAQYIPIDENHPLIAQSPYAASKIAADNLALSYYRSFGTPIKILRPFNTYGPRQSLRAIIPSIILQMFSKKKNLIVGNLFPKRDFTYVTDTVNAFYQISKSKLAIGKTLNFGSGSEIEVASLVNLIMTKLNKNKKIIIDNKRKRSKKSEVNRLFCDNRKFFETLGLKRKKLISLEQGLTKTIFFLKKNLIKYNNKVDLYNI